MVIRSRVGYDNAGIHALTRDSEIVDIEENGRIISSGKVKDLKMYLRRLARNGEKCPYSNVIGLDYIKDPDLVESTPRIIITVYHDGSFGITGDSKLVGCTRSGKNYAFEFANGFVIGLMEYSVWHGVSDRSIITFRCLGFRETFSFVDNNYVDGLFKFCISVYNYTDDSLIGEIECATSDTGYAEDYQVRKLGEFILTREGTVYKNEKTDVVYNMTRYTKELVLHG